MSRKSILTALLLGLMLSAPRLWAQDQEEPTASYQPPGEVESTVISFELLTGARGQNFAARQWYDLFSDLKIPLRIRQSVREEKPVITEEIKNKVRSIHVVALVEIDGSLKLPSGRVKRSEDEKLKSWIDSLREFGAQGNPSGKPLWGLSAEQYQYVREALSRELTVNLKEKSLSEGLLQIPFPPELQLVLSDKTKNHLSDGELRELSFSEDLQGISSGSALAIFLRDYGLAFEPTRLPNGRVVLTVSPLEDAEKPWPVGWDWEGNPKQIAPHFFKVIPVRIRDFTLYEFLDYIEKGSEIPIVIDQHSFRAIRLDPGSLKLTIRPDVTAWNLLLNKGLVPLRLRAERRLDEAGDPFLWVGPSSTLIRQRLKAIETGELDENGEEVSPQEN